MDGSLGSNSRDRDPASTAKADARLEPENAETVVNALPKPIQWSFGCSWSLVTREAVLVGGMVLAFGVVAPFSYYFSGVHGVVGAMLAVVVCLVGASVALAASVLLRGAAMGFAGLLVSMTVRTGFPIALLVLIHLQDGLRKQPTLVYYFLFFYFLALMIETPLSLPVPDRPPQRRETPPQSH